MSSINQLKKDIAEDIRERIKFEIERDNLIYTGQLKNSWEIKKDGEDLIIGSRLIWAKVMEWGRLPGKMPPVKVLIPWVFQKIKVETKKKIIRAPFPFPHEVVSESTEDVQKRIKNIAYLIARKIAEKGIEGRRYVKRALFLLEADTR